MKGLLTYTMSQEVLEQKWHWLRVVEDLIQKYWIPYQWLKLMLVIVESVYHGFDFVWDFRCVYVESSNLKQKQLFCFYWFSVFLQLAFSLDEICIQIYGIYKRYLYEQSPLYKWFLIKIETWSNNSPFWMYWSKNY